MDGEALLREYLNFVTSRGLALLYALDAQKQIEPVIRVLDNDIICSDFTGGEGGEEMPPKYADGSLRQRKNGIYEYRFMHLDNKRYSVYGKDPQACYDKRTELLSGKVKIKTEKALGKAIKYEDWLDIWYKEYKAPYNGEDSLKSIQYYFNRDIKPAFGKMQIRAITGLQIQSFINKYNNTKNIQKKIYDIINGSIETLCDLHILNYNPCRAVKIESYTVKHYPVLQPRDQCRILENIKLEKYKRLFVFCCCTGLRIGEALKVKVEHLDFINNTFEVVKRESRTKGRNRIIPFLDELFSNYDLNHKQLFYDITYEGASQYLDKLCKKLDIDFTLHSTRHTFISCCYHVGIKDKQIQLWAGHASIDMTLNTYTHILDNQNSYVLDYIKRLKEKLGI